ncbi:MAG: CbtA family protein, partial [Patulibacter sp.]
MAKNIVWRGLLAGLIAAIPAFIIAKLLGEPQINKAIDYEGGRDSAIEALQAAAGKAVEEMGHDPFSRATQSTWGLLTGIVLMGIAYAGFWAFTYGMVREQFAQLSPRALALLVAIAGFLTLYFFPTLKYPANPPAIGHEETIGARTGLYLAMVAVSICAMIVAVWLAVRLQPAKGWWNSILIGAGLFLAIQIVAQLVLPQLGHLSANVAEYGRQATETPLPLKDANGTIVFPGFPADVLAQFRLYSLVNQLVLWGGIGVIAGSLLQRATAPAVARAPRGDLAGQAA